MGYSADVITRARARLLQAKQDRESENRQHLEYAYRLVPRIREIDYQLRRTMAQAAQAAFQAGSDSQALLEQAREQNLSLQEERAALVIANFEEGFLDETPICEKCGGSGYIGANMCECLRELCRQEQKKEISILAGGKENFNQFRLEYYPDRIDPQLGVNIRALMEKNFQTCRHYAYTFSEKSGNLLFSGDTGLGKTFLAACIARTVADRGYSVVYESAGHLFSKLERSKFGNDPALYQQTQAYTQADLLIIDDLGTEMVNQFVVSTLYTLVNDRLLLGKATIISTNLHSEDLDLRYSPQIASRLRGSFKRIAFLGDDIRSKRNW